MSKSLRTLANNLLEDKTRFKDTTLKMFPSNFIDLVTQKEVFSCKYIKTVRTDLPKQLYLPIQNCITFLTNENTSDAYYVHTQSLDNHSLHTY